MECINFKSKVSGSLIGFADILVPKWGVELSGCPVFQKGDNTWVSMPSRKWDDNGEEKWVPIARFQEKEHAMAFSRKALEALNAWKEKNQPSNAYSEAKQDYNDGVPF